MDKPVEIHISANSQNLYIFFGGIAAGIAMPPFEFYGASKILEESKIFVRDFYQCWYQAGLPGVSNDVFSTALYLKHKIEEINPIRVFFVGNSMGGYASILYSSLIGTGEVIAFAPQTFISPLLRLRYGDFRWQRQIFNTYRRGFFKSKEWNLRKLLLRSGSTNKISVFVSTSHKLDYIHASYINDAPGVTVYGFDEGGHNVVRLLRDKGQLPAIMSGNYVSHDATI